MKTTVRIAFALVLLSLPGRHVLAQAAPKAFAPTEPPKLVRDEPSVGPEASIPTPPEALLWQPLVENREMTVEPPVAAPLPRAWSDWSTQKKVLIVGGGVVALMILGIVSIG